MKNLGIEHIALGAAMFTLGVTGVLVALAVTMIRRSTRRTEWMWNHVKETCLRIEGLWQVIDVALAERRDDTAREHCGETVPSFLAAGQTFECVLRPGHSGSHADEQGGRWRYHDVADRDRREGLIEDEDPVEDLA